MFAETSAKEVSAVIGAQDVRVPVSALVGAEGEGGAHLERALEISRVFIAASSLGTASRVLELSLKYSQVRVTFSKPIAGRQAIQRYLAEMAADVYALRGMLVDAESRAALPRRAPEVAGVAHS
ncbi:acyl-CoA dehydrogenase family protein [Streptomyces sp. KR55]|uniref:acyl-CoA dehydrogenase family protein n=1 Tax=Streptomyces sp. KR55 TaxID=3457425 RepID=UPI003FCF5E2A